ncbi:MAG TPA: hypothetical protein VGO97_03665 [Solirubrobacterales bacterium]|nr:hypothetical protein [Solirubrobacterales bacterium]
MDLAPVFKWSGAGYALPDGAGDWITTDPDAQDAYFNERAQVLGSNLKPLVRMIKRWNSVHSRHLKSFHLEVLVNQAFSSLGDNSRRACELFFEWAPNNLGVNDPAGHSGDLSQYLRLDSRQAIVNNLNSAKTRATQAIEAENRSDHREAIRLWRIVFGDEFPAYG